MAGLAGQASGIGLPKVSRVMSAGSGPPRRPVSRPSIAASCSPVSRKSKMSKFSAMRCGFVDFGMAERPCCRCQRSITRAGVLPCAVAISPMTGSCRALVWPLTVPVLHPGRAPDDITGADLLDRSAPFLGAADAFGDDQPLAGRVGVPGRARPGLEGDVRAAVGSGLFLGEQRSDADLAGEVLGRAGTGRLRSTAGDHSWYLLLSGGGRPGAGTG